MKKLIFLYVLLCAAASCASIPGQNREVLQDQLKAENRLMKKNSELALRENEVLKTENAQYKTEVKKLSDAVRRLNEELEALKMKYDADMAIASQAYEDLCSHFTVLEIESDQKIQTLTESYAALEKKSSDEAANLNHQLNEQQENFSAERNLLISGFESRIKELDDLLASSRQASTQKDKKIEALEKDQQYAGSKIIELEKTIQDQDEKIQKFETLNRDLVLSNQTFQKDIEQKQIVIDQLTEKLKGVDGASSQTSNH
jgi:chromosome segregation ATPase